MDLSSSLTPRSDQLNADDLISGPITVTIKEVTAGKAEQPFDFQLVEYPGRAYRPSLGMRRAIVTCWGSDTAIYAGRRLTLFRNPEITFGPNKVGGIQVSHASDIAGPVELLLTVSRGKRVKFTVKPLVAATGRDWLGELAKVRNDEDKVEALGRDAKAANAPTDVLSQIRARYIELRNA